MRLPLLALAALGLVASELHPAEACECALNDHPLAPADGATAVPTNAAIFYPTVPTQVTQIALADPSGAAVAMTVTMHGTFLIAKPNTPLAAGTVYRLTTETTAGTFHMAFTTGDAADTTPPVFAGITAVHPETVGIVPDTSPTGACQACGIAVHDDHVSRMRLEFASPPDDAVVVAATVLDGATAVAEIGMSPAAWTGRELGFGGCGNAAPALDPGGSYCARVIAYDVAGNVAGGEAMACAAAATCKPATVCSIPDDCEPMSEPTPGEPGGCSTSPAPGLVLALGSLVIARRRRR